MLEAIKAHPIISSVVALCTVGGAVIAPFFTPEDWSLARQIAAGTVAGLGIGLIIVATRMTGAFADDIEDDGRG